MKIVDWNAFWLSLVQMLVGIFLLAASSSEHPGYTVFGGALAVLGLWQCVQSLKGTVFASDHIRFYSYMVGRRIDIDDIKAANCEFGLRLSPMLLFALAGGGSGRRGRSSGSMSLRSYMVNLSGDFGTRQIRFYNKRWRDAFLMKLRDRAPRCRITRWS